MGDYNLYLEQSRMIVRLEMKWNASVEDGFMPALGQSSHDVLAAKFAAPNVLGRPEGLAAVGLVE